MEWIMARDQYGNTIHALDAKHPRKDLLEKLYKKSAVKMYCDTVDGEAKHTGYVVGNQWFTFYKVTEWK